jgi:hypothetical protein
MTVPSVDGHFQINPPQKAFQEEEGHYSKSAKNSQPIEPSFISVFAPNVNFSFFYHSRESSMKINANHHPFPM